MEGEGWREKDGGGRGGGIAYPCCIINEDVCEVSLRQAHESKSSGCCQSGHYNLVLSKFLYRGDGELFPLNPGVEDKYIQKRCTLYCQLAVCAEHA